MAHQLRINKNGKADFFSVKEKAWHGLGKIVDNALTSSEAIIEAGLDFTVDKGEVYVKYSDEVKERLDKKGEVIEKKYGTYRIDTGEVFGIVGSRYEIIQNTSAFDFFDNIVGENQAIFETAGALYNGKVIFVTAKLPSNIIVGNDDVIDKYLLLTMAHDGTSPVRAMFTPIRVVCNNTLQAALATKNYITIRHTANAHEKIKQAQQLMNITVKASSTTEELYTAMTKIHFNDDQINLMIAQSLDLKIETDGSLSTKSTNTIHEVREYLEFGPGQQMQHCRGTLYGVYNGVNGYLNNEKTYSSAESRMENLTDPNGLSFKYSTKALEIAQGIVTNSSKIVSLYY